MFHLLATFAVAFGVAGVVYAFYRGRGRRPPKFLIPAAAGISMLAYNIWSEYSWYARTTEALPASVVVVSETTYRAPWQPWTYLFPRTVRFAAVDRSRSRRNDALPGYVMAELILVERLEATKTLMQMFDCKRARLTDIDLAVGVDDSGLPRSAKWRPIDRHGRLFQGVCDAG